MMKLISKFHHQIFISPLEIINNHNGLYIINYIPNQIGQIQIDIYLNHKLLNKTPYKVNIFDINQINLSNLTDGFIDQIKTFDIDISKAGIGQLEILIENGKIPCEVITNNTSQFSIVFLPYYSGLCQIDIKFNGISIPSNSFLYEKKRFDNKFDLIR